MTKPKGYTKQWNELKDKIIKRDGRICCHCREIYTKKGKVKQLHLSHILPRGQYPGLTFDENNVKLLCSSCHLRWYHKNPVEAYLWLIEYKGLRFINRLLKKAHGLQKSVQTTKRLKTNNRQKD